MTAKVRLWWQSIKHHPVATVLISLLALLVVLVLLGGYNLNWGWTGFNGSNKSGKTLWDWMQLLFIPVVLAVAGFWFNHREREAAELRAENEQKAAELRAAAEREIEQQRAEAERKISFDNQREAALQAYLDRMAELLLEKNLRTSPSEEVRNVARIRTITVLTQLDVRRVSYVFAFLREAGLISTQSKSGIVSLDGADFHGVQWSQADLSHANLSGTDLHEANLSGADLRGANLSNSILSSANLSQTNLESADLSNTDLIGADLSQAYLMHTDFTDAELIGASLSKAYLHSTNFRRADLLDANLSEADLYNAKFDGTGITKKQLAQANVKTTL